MSKAHLPTGTENEQSENEGGREGLEQHPIQKQSDGSYRVGERGGPLGEGESPWEAFNDYAHTLRAYSEGEDVPLSEMPYHGTMKRPVNYIMIDAERLPDGSWHVSEVGGNIAGHGPTKEAARIHLGELACYVSTSGDD